MEGTNQDAQMDQTAVVVEPELKDTTDNSLKDSTAKGPRRRRRRLAGW